MISKKDLPQGWELVKLKDLGKIVTGNTPSKSNSNYYGGKLPWIKTPDLKTKYISNSVDTISEEGRKVSRILPKGSVMVSCIGNIGQVGIANCEVSTNQQINSIIPNLEIVIPEFIYYSILLNKEIIAKKASKAVLPLLNKTNFSQIEIILPPLKTQKKIVEILEKAEGVKNERESLNELTKEYLESVFYEMFGDPVKNEKGWKINPLEYFGRWQSGGTPLRSKTKYFEGNIPWFIAGELNSMYVINSNEHINEQAIKESGAKMIEEKSLLLGMYDTAALKSSINLKPCTCNQAIVYSKINENGNVYYLYHLIQIAKEHFKRHQRGVRQKNLNLPIVKNLEIPTPPIE
nr:restriction endonuclease subunit S [Candidatus Woesearchaeota archaeon]